MACMKYSVTLEEDENGELILPIPEQILKEMNWKTGDTLKFNDNKDGSFSMTKVESETKLVLVETISTFRMRYVIRQPKNSPNDWALDTVSMDEAVELSQKHINNDIISHRVISKEEYLEIFDQDNDYLSSWDEPQKLNFVTKLDDKGNIVD